MMKPILKLWRDLGDTDFVEHAAWTNWYAPDEMEALVTLGFDEQETRDVLAAVGWSEDYAFALPAAGASMEFMRLCVSARVTTSGGATLIGYLASASVAVFYQGKLYHFNRSLPDLSARQAQDLGSCLGEQSIFPLRVELPALQKTLEFGLAAS